MRLSDFGPDQPQITDGMIQDALNYFPVTGGFRTFPGLRALSAGLPSACKGWFSNQLTATPVFAAATASGLYVADATGNLKPNVLGFANVNNRWRFGAYGTPGTPQNLYAVDGIDPNQVYQLATGLFAPMPVAPDGTTPPIASIVSVSDYSLILVMPNSQTFLSTFNVTPPSWNGSVPNQVYIQPITQSPGNITAAHRLRNAMVFYKPTAAHVAYFAGGTVGWDVQDSSIQYGVLNQEWVINTGDYHFFPTLTHDFWQFDGWNLSRLPNNLAEFFRQDHDDAFMYLMYGQYDSIRELLIWYYASESANPRGTLDTALIYYLRSGKWSFQRLNVEIPFVYFNPQDNHLYNGYFGLDHAPRIYDDSVKPGRSYITSNFFGDYRNMYESQRIRPGFQILPDSSTCTPIIQDVAGQIVGPPGDIAAQPGSQKEILTDDGWYNLQVTGRLKAYQIVTQGLAEIVSIEPIEIFAGET